MEGKGRQGEGKDTDSSVNSGTCSDPVGVTV